MCSWLGVRVRGVVGYIIWELVEHVYVTVCNFFSISCFHIDFRYVTLVRWILYI